MVVFSKSESINLDLINLISLLVPNPVFEDISINLKNPKKLGFKTVLIKSKSHPDKKNKITKTKKEENIKYIDFTSYCLTEFLNQINLDINA